MVLPTKRDMSNLPGAREELYTDRPGVRKNDASQGAPVSGVISPDGRFAVEAIKGKLVLKICNQAISGHFRIRES